MPAYPALQDERSRSPMRTAETFAQETRVQLNAYKRPANGGPSRHVGIHSFLTVVEDAGQRDKGSCASGSAT